MIGLRSLALGLSASFMLAAAPQKYTYWVQPCTDAASMCQPGDPQLAAWALEAWQKAAGGELQFTRVKDPEHARIRLY